jgi:uncharacterized repeat protein (TIGR03803 family)
VKSKSIARIHKLSQILSVAVILGALSLSLRAQATYTVSYSFSGSNGAQPTAALTPDGEGNYYGTTTYGGTSGFGTVFKLSPSSGGGWSETALYSFTGTTDGSQPASGVVLDSTGNLYGTTVFGGTFCPSHGCGVAFKLSKSGSVWKENVLYSFSGTADGGAPNGVIFGSGGKLFGSAATGGSSGNGVVFELSKNSGAVGLKL